MTETRPKTGAFVHVREADAALRSALRDALDGEMPADFLRKTSKALAAVASLIPWASREADGEE